MWVGIGYWNKPGKYFARDLIDNVLGGDKTQIVKYRRKKYRVIDGHYGHCEWYPTGFIVRLEECK